MWTGNISIAFWSRKKDRNYLKWRQKQIIVQVLGRFVLKLVEMQPTAMTIVYEE